MGDELSYVYAVGVRIPRGVVADLRGIGDHPVRLVEDGGIAAVVGSVPADEFTAEQIEERLQDLAWISETARAHHRVVDVVGAQAVVAPFALATVYRDDARVEQILRERAGAFAAVLDRLRGRAEWGVKAWAGSAPQRSEGGRASSGAEYLRRRRAVLRESERETDVAFDAAEKLHGTAAGGADAARRHRLHEPALSGRSEPMVLNGAYLVHTGHVDRWRAAVEEAGERSGLSVEVTGPWVPYSFVDEGSR
ncbi:GvpL/GvpF family gas vesicle protein [Pseudonocardia endophytica]|uniref:Gas vesicle protein GvpL/GvpF n=1 Tax=Pseudonocardia endophytica TaxID=401976 RepID=A0A4R1HVR3_PSEEN|nr:GvpL/GvpF family gas vesicle protein [Pseudonocardia endophytica]TCK21592.1 gas vesicle protein GvpL/GvpF [Pseudonocardia endophytica]